VPQDVHKVLKMTNLNTLFDTHESEEGAVLPFYSKWPRWEPSNPSGPPAPVCL